MSVRSPDPAEPGAVLAALKTKPPAAVARPLGGPVLTAAARGAPPALEPAPAKAGVGTEKRCPAEQRNWV